MFNDQCCREAPSALGPREGRALFLVVLGGIGKLFTEEMVVKGRAEEQEIKVCV